MNTNDDVVARVELERNGVDRGGVCFWFCARKE